MKAEELFFDELINENRCVKVRNTIDYCKGFSDDTENIEVIEKLRKIIEPWLSGILQSEHLALLVGAGLTQSVCCIADVLSSSMGTADFKEYQVKIDSYAQKAAQKMGRGKYNIEDQIRTSLEMLTIPSTHIVVIAYNADERLIGFLKTVNLDQVTLLCGSEIASIDKLVSYYLPKAAIDKISVTVSKLLKERESFKEETTEDSQKSNNE